MKKGLLVITSLLVILGLTACGNGDATNKSGKEKVVFGYFPNVDHASAMVAREKGYFEKELGKNTEIEYKTFPDGGTFMTALESGEIDAGLVGVGPVLNHYANGANVKILAGASSGGTVVVASKKSGITNVKQAIGKTFITPGIGCTHDVQFEAYLMGMENKDLASSRTGGKLTHVTGNPASYQAMFESGKVDLAAVPEPWASILVQGGAKIIVSTEDIAFGKELPNTVLVSNTKLMKKNREAAENLVKAHKQAINFLNSHQDEAQAIIIDSIKTLTNQEIDKDVTAKAMKRITFTTDIDEDILTAFGKSSYDLKFLKENPSFDGLVETALLKKND